MSGGRDEGRELRQAAFSERQRLTAPRRRNIGAPISTAEAHRILSEAAEEPRPVTAREETPLEAAARALRQAAFADREKNVRNKGNSKLKISDVRSIRRQYWEWNWTQIDLARQYGVSDAAISKLLSGKNWEWLDAPDLTALNKKENNT